MNQAVAMWKARVPVQFLGAVGKDGTWIIDWLQKSVSGGLFYEIFKIKIKINLGGI